MYSCGHPGAFNPAVITNKEAHMVFGNMNKDAGISNAAAGGKKRSSPEISNYFSKRGQPPFSGKDRVRQLPQGHPTTVSSQIL